MLYWPTNTCQKSIETTKIEEETVEKEMEHALLQDSLDKELEELSKKLEQKEVSLWILLVSELLKSICKLIHRP